MDKNELKFRAIGLMADRNQDIRLTNTVAECKTCKEGSLLTFGIDSATGHMLRKQMAGVKANTHIVVCLVLDAAQLDAIVKELQDRAPDYMTQCPLCHTEVMASQLIGDEHGHFICQRCTVKTAPANRDK